MEKDSRKAEEQQWEKQLTVYFPSRRTVQESIGGRAGAGTICFNRQSYSGRQFPRDIMRDNINQRSGILMHSKVSHKRKNFQGLVLLSSSNINSTDTLRQAERKVHMGELSHLSRLGVPW